MPINNQQDRANGAPGGGDVGAPRNYDDLIDGPEGDNINVTPVPPARPAQPINDETYNSDEQRDVNEIRVSIEDSTTPIVVFFGAQSSGKSLVLLRMIRYLEHNGYTIVPVETFRPSTDRHYARMCKELKVHAYSSYAPDPTDDISFMLVKVVDSTNHTVCQFLEAPGEHYFDGEVDSLFPLYITEIIQKSNPKVWVFFMELNWGTDSAERERYASKVAHMRSRMRANDRVIMLFNKADGKRAAGKTTPDGQPNTEAFFTAINDQYPGAFKPYRNHGLLRLLYDDYNFKSLCFSSGVFTPTAKGKQQWTLGDDKFCRDLWNAIK